MAFILGYKTGWRDAISGNVALKPEEQANDVYPPNTVEVQRILTHNGRDFVVNGGVLYERAAVSLSGEKKEWKPNFDISREVADLFLHPTETIGIDE